MVFGLTTGKFYGMVVRVDDNWLRYTRGGQEALVPVRPKFLLVCPD